MPIFKLSEELVFPPVHLAEDGLLAIGGDLSRARLLLAYRSGIFPWYSQGEPILWWSPDPRMVVFPQEAHASRRLRRKLRQGVFQITLNQDFRGVVRACAETPRRHEEGTWITQDMEAAYVALHDAGHACSIEAWRDGELAGGFYGVAIGACFFGESMFTRESDASKAAFAVFAAHFGAAGGLLIDCQVANPHLARLGAREIPRKRFLSLLAQGVKGNLTADAWNPHQFLAAPAFGEVRF